MAGVMGLLVRVVLLLDNLEDLAVAAQEVRQAAQETLLQHRHLKEIMVEPALLPQTMVAVEAAAQALLVVMEAAQLVEMEATELYQPYLAHPQPMQAAGEVVYITLPVL